MKSKNKTPRGRGNKLKHPGLMEDAKHLKVSRAHLAYVLNGERQSQSLLKRYRDLQRVKRDVERQVAAKLRAA